MDGQDIIICRCREVTEEEIVQAVRDGASTVDGVRRRETPYKGLYGALPRKDMRKACRTHCSPRERP